MTEGYLNRYISQRMREMGFKKYHFESVAIIVKGREVNFIAAYNEYYYLVATTLPKETLIVGDTHFLLAKDFDKLTYARLHEFTGNITIETQVDCTIEFIRVIPQL